MYNKLFVGLKNINFGGHLYDVLMRLFIMNLVVVHLYDVLMRLFIMNLVVV